MSEGGEAFVLGKAELRCRLRGNVEGALFADIGNLWLDPRSYRLVDLRANVGVGLRFVTPIGPAALDVGFNVTPDGGVNERERRGPLHNRAVLKRRAPGLQGAAGSDAGTSRSFRHGQDSARGRRLAPRGREPDRVVELPELSSIIPARWCAAARWTRA